VLLKVLFSFIFAVSAVLFLAPATLASGQGKRQAIVIGNSNYLNGALKNPLNDSDAVSIAAQDIGFDVRLIKDAKLKDMRIALKGGIASAKNADILMLFFAGHGVQSGGKNYLLPVDINIRSAGELPKAAISVADIVEWLAEANVKASIIFLDACRNNPFPQASIAEPGLAFVEGGSGELVVSYAAGTGAVAYDGAGPNSPYSSALVEALRMPNLDVYTMLRQVRGRVREVTDGRQIPWVSGSIEREIVLNQVSTTEIADTADGPAAAEFSGELDDTAWNTIQASTNPSYFQKFVGDFPTSPHVELAVARIDALTKQNKRSIAVSYAEPAVASLAETASPLRDPLMSLIDYCDILAASETDPLRLGPGVPLYALDAQKAILACTDAISKFPDQARFQYQLARALAMDDRWPESAVYATAAADRGYAEGYSLLAWMNAAGLGMPKNPQRAIELWRTGARLGSPNARANLGRSYRDGFGVEASNPDAFYWLKLAALTGERVAADDLGNMYRNGDGVGADITEAARWYYLSASLGGSNAMTTIANLYRDGKGVGRDLESAGLWYQKAIAAGNRFAPFQFARLKLKENDGKSSPDIFKLLVLAGDRGFAEGYLQAAKLYEAEKADKKGRERAYFYALLASGSGFDGAGAFVAKLKSSMRPDNATKIEGEAAIWLEQNGDFARKSAYAK
jgi:TPR repeat protein